jgi:hypothetical protein
MTQRSNQPSTARAAVSAATPRTSIIDREWEPIKRSTAPLRVAVPRPSSAAPKQAPSTLRIAQPSSPRVARVATLPPPLPRQHEVRAVPHLPPPPPPPPLRAPRAITLTESDFMEDTDVGLRPVTQSAPPASPAREPRRRRAGIVAAVAVACVAITAWVGLPHFAQGLSALDGLKTSGAQPAFLRSSALAPLEPGLASGPASNVGVLAAPQKPGPTSGAAKAKPAKVAPAMPRAGSKKAKARKAQSPSSPGKAKHGGKP